MGLFARSLNDLGRFLLERFSGRFTALVEAAGHSAERLVAELHRQRVPVMAMGLDHELWYRGQGARYRQGPRRHRTRTVFY